MKKAIISVLMTLLVLVNMSSSGAVALSRNNQLNAAAASGRHVVNVNLNSNNNFNASHGGNDDTNKSSAADLLKQTLAENTRVPAAGLGLLNNSNNSSIAAAVPPAQAGQHQIRSELEQIRHQAKLYFEEIKSSLENVGCQFGISAFCEDLDESNQNQTSSTLTPNDDSLDTATTELEGPDSTELPSSTSGDHASVSAAIESPATITNVTVSETEPSVLNATTTSTIAPIVVSESPSPINGSSPELNASTIAPLIVAENPSPSHKNETVPEFNTTTTTVSPAINVAGNSNPVNESVPELNATTTTVGPVAI